MKSIYYSNPFLIASPQAGYSLFYSNISCGCATKIFYPCIGQNLSNAGTRREKGGTKNENDSNNDVCADVFMGAGKKSC